MRLAADAYSIWVTTYAGDYMTCTVLHRSAVIYKLKHDEGALKEMIYADVSAAPCTSTS